MLNLTQTSKMLGMLAVLTAGSLRASESEPQVVVTDISAQALTPQAASGNTPAALTAVTYVDGQLTIDAHDATMSGVLAQIAAVTGVTIDIPEGSANERMQIVKFGPGPARQVLASLLSDSSFDYLIQSSDSNSEKLQSVLLMSRKRKSSGTVELEAAEVPSQRRGPRNGSSASSGDGASSIENSTRAQTENVAVEATAANTAVPMADPNQSLDAALSQRGLTSASRPGGLAPPQTMNSQNINQQLQQMYQQRMQMTQQNRSAVSASQE